MSTNLLRALLPAIAFLSATSLFAEPIAYRIVLPTTGSITYTNGTTQDFTGANTVLTIFGDTTNVKKLYIDGVPQGDEILYIPASIAIQGVGVFGARNFQVSDDNAGGLEILQYNPGNLHLSQTITVQLSQDYHLQTNLTSEMSFSTNVFNMGTIQTNAGKISFTNTTGQGTFYAKVSQ